LAPRLIARPRGGSSVTFRLVDGPWGPIHLAASEVGLVALELLTTTDAFLARLERRTTARPMADGVDRLAGRVLDQAEREIVAFFEGSRTDRDVDVTVELVGLADWDRRVLAAVRSIPYGAVTSYGRLARMAGSPGAARAAGGAVGRNPIGLFIPCHRVLAGDGSLGGYGGGWGGSRELRLEIKRSLLQREGVSIPASHLIG
jgi:methylated-DNA-[protein]-cysteine S-methyltransferase